jgi:hypothetical protein
MFSLFNLSSAHNTEAGQSAVVLLFFVALVVVGIIFVALPMLGLGTATAETLQTALGQ